MKVKRFFAATMPQALRLVRDEMGADAVILSSRRVEGGVEIVTALNYDEGEARQRLGSSATRYQCGPRWPNCRLSSTGAWKMSWNAAVAVFAMCASVRPGWRGRPHAATTQPRRSALWLRPPAVPPGDCPRMPWLRCARRSIP